MQNFIPNCIFCFNALTDSERHGRGEHVIPEMLGGTLRIKDVCKSCNNTLGRVADHTALEDVRVINAIQALDLPELKGKIRDRGTGRLTDPTINEKTQVYFKHGKPKVIPRQISGGPFVTDEQDWPQHLRNLVSKDSTIGLAPAEVNRIIDNLKVEYTGLGHGESIYDPTLRVRLKKSGGEIRAEPRITESACNRMVAKIAYETAWLTFNPERWATAQVLGALAAIAMGNGDLQPAQLMYPVRHVSPLTQDGTGPQYHHQIVTWFERNWTFIDIYLFGVVDFRLFVPHDSPGAPIHVPKPDNNICMVSFAMTFCPGEKRSKQMFYKRDGEEEIVSYCGDGIL